MFSIASVPCGVAPTLWLLIGARATQGLGAAVMMALTMAFIGETVPKETTGSAMGLLGTMSAIGTALGPSLGGVLIAGLGWRAIFFVNVPLGSLTFLLALRHLPANRPQPATDHVRFDHVGTLLLAMTLAAYALALTIGRGSFGLLNIALLVAAVASRPFCARGEKGGIAFDPAVDVPRSCAEWQSGHECAGFDGNHGHAGRRAVLPVTRVRTRRGDAGLVLSAGPVAAALAGVPSGRLVDRLGAQRMTIVGLVGIAAGCTALAMVPVAFGLAGYLAPIVVLTVGYALFQAANNTAIMADVGPDQRGVVSGMLNLSRNLGFVTGASVLGAIFALASSAGDIGAAGPAAFGAGMRITFAEAAGLIVLALAIAFVNETRSVRMGHSADN